MKNILGKEEKLMELNNKKVFVTGAGGYLCSEIAIGFAKAGAKVAVLDLRLEKAQSVTDQIIKLGGDAIAIEIDVSVKEQQIKSLDSFL